MSVSTSQPAESSNKAGKFERRRKKFRSSSARSVLAYGEPVVWLTGGARVLSIVMIIALLALVTVIGLGTFSTRPLLQVELRDGRKLMGELAKQEVFKLQADRLTSEAPEVQTHVMNLLVSHLDNLDAMADQIQKRRDALSAEKDEVAAKLERVEAAIESINADLWIPKSPSERAQAIINDPRTARLKELRVSADGLRQRFSSLQSEIEAATKAIGVYRDAPNRSIEQILAAEPPIRDAGINSLVALVRDAAGDEAIEFRRRLLRTGNFELTNEHFDWVADYQIAEGGETTPQQALLVERTAWGRFYGIPERFVTIHRRTRAEAEMECSQVSEYLAMNSSLLSEEQRTQLDRELAAVDKDLGDLRSTAVQQFIEQTNAKLPAGVDVSFGLADGQQKSQEELSLDDDVREIRWVANDTALAWSRFEEVHAEVLEREHHAKHLEKHALGVEYAAQEKQRLAVRQAEIDHDAALLEESEAFLSARRIKADLAKLVADAKVVHETVKKRYPSAALVELSDTIVNAATEPLLKQISEQEAVLEEQDRLFADAPEKAVASVRRYFDVQQATNIASERIQQEIRELRSENERYQLHLVTADGQPKELAAGEVVRAFQPNNLTGRQGWGVYLSRWWEFLTDEPREANSEGGVMPAIWGTIVMTLLMSVAVVPFGVMAALYLREYAKAGVVVSIIRIAINNLAGVPSIVFGVFGWGFFCLIIGAYIDGGPKNASFETMPTARWYVGMAILVGIAFGAFLTGVLAFSGPIGTRQSWKRWVGYGSGIAWVVATCLFFYLVFKTPLFSGFYEAKLPSPSWGKPGVVWAALTLSLMTLPVVIVATEEALSAVPNSMRQGSYGCGASKWQTIRRIVLPHAMPGIMTGMILAMARGAGEVAPLMLTGAVKLAPELPLDGYFPYLHGSRSFMHLGFHIYDVGFQSQNSEAAKPMVYTTTLLLIAIVTVLNLLAVWLRAFLRRRFVSGQF